jgi:hypothetical protein
VTAPPYDPIEYFLTGAELTDQVDLATLQQNYQSSYIDNLFSQIEYLVKYFDKTQRLMVRHTVIDAESLDMQWTPFRALMISSYEKDKATGIEDVFGFTAQHSRSGNIRILVSNEDGSFIPPKSIATLKLGQTTLWDQKIAEIFCLVGQRLKPFFHKTNVYEFSPKVVS